MNDSLDNLFIGDTGPVRTAPVRVDAVAYKPAEQRFEENCPKCRGTGRFVGYSGRVFGQCFTCKGKGKFMFKTSPEARAANRQASAERAARKDAETLAAFETQSPEVFAWIKANAGKFDFSTKMVEAIIRYGDLTEGQRAAVERCIARDVAKATERADRVQQAPQVDTAGIDRLKVAFDKAKAYAAAKAPGLTIRNPKITIGGMTISPAKATSANPGALYVKASGAYLGKIADGTSLPPGSAARIRPRRCRRSLPTPPRPPRSMGRRPACAASATRR